MLPERLHTGYMSPYVPHQNWDTPSLPPTPWVMSHTSNHWVHPSKPQNSKQHCPNNHSPFSRSHMAYQYVIYGPLFRPTNLIISNLVKDMIILLGLCLPYCWSPSSFSIQSRHVLLTRSKTPFHLEFWDIFF